MNGRWDQTCGHYKQYLFLNELLTLQRRLSTPWKSVCAYAYSPFKKLLAPLHCAKTFLVSDATRNSLSKGTSSNVMGWSLWVYKESREIVKTHDVESSLPSFALLGVFGMKTGSSHEAVRWRCEERALQWPLKLWRWMFLTQRWLLEEEATLCVGDVLFWDFKKIMKVKSTRVWITNICFTAYIYIL